jgi:antitoxin HicB
MEHDQARFEPDHEAGGFVITFPDFGYGATQGETEEEAMDMGRELLRLTIGDFIRARRPLPAAVRRRGRAIDLDAAFVESGLKKAEFARRTGIPKMHVDRLFSLEHRSLFDQIEAAFAALGKRRALTVRDAA